MLQESHGFGEKRARAILFDGSILQTAKILVPGWGRNRPDGSSLQQCTVDMEYLQKYSREVEKYMIIE